MRMASSTTEVTQHVTAAFPTAAKPAAATARYVVRPGHTLSGIAAALDVRGGWQTLYELDRGHRRGPDVIHRDRAGVPRPDDPGPLHHPGR